MTHVLNYSIIQEDMKSLNAYLFLVALSLILAFITESLILAIVLNLWLLLGFIISLHNQKGSEINVFFVAMLLVAFGPLSFPVIRELKRRNEW